MRNMLDEYVTAYGSWLMQLGGNGLARSVQALDLMRSGNYSTQEVLQDVYELWRDLADFNVPLVMGAVPAATMEISSWGGVEYSNFVHVPVLPATRDFYITQMVNPTTNTVLDGFGLDDNGGENALRVTWSPPAGVLAPPPADPNRGGLFQGAIFESDGEETGNYHRIVATVYAHLRLP